MHSGCLPKLPKRGVFIKTLHGNNNKFLWAAGAESYIYGRILVQYSTRKPNQAQNDYGYLACGTNYFPGFLDNEANLK